MSRRTVGVLTLATGLALGAGGVLLGSAGAASCPSWTDAAGDANLAVTHAVTEDDNMDIVAAKFGVVGDKMVAQIRSTAVSSGYSDFGDEFRIAFTLNGKSMLFFADRDEVSVDAGFYNSTDDLLELGGTVTYDTATDTVTFSHTLAKLDAALGSAAAGKTATAISAKTYDQLQGATVWNYDTANYTGTYTVGTCTLDGGTPAPSGSASTSPSASPSSSPSGSPSSSPSTPPSGTASPSPSPTGSVNPDEPKQDCATIGDIKTDGTPTVATVSGNKVGTPNDPDLDLTGVVLRTTPTHLKAFVKVDHLAARPAHGLGHQFDFGFAVGTKVFVFYTSSYDAANSARDALSPTALIPRTGGRVGTATSTSYDARLKVTGEYSTAKSWVVISVERASLDTVLGAPLTNGTVVTATNGHSHVGTVTGSVPADTAQAAQAAEQVYTVGVSPCFPPPPSKFAPISAVSVQYGDLAKVSAKLTTESGTPIAGKVVTFAVGTERITAKTDATGVARASLRTSRTAGAYTMVTSFAGDDTAGAVTASVPFTVKVEACRIALSVAKSGSRRTVTATLSDDDRAALKGQTVTWYVGGRKVASGRTDSRGRAAYGGAKPGQTVVAKFAGVAGRYAAASKSVRV